MNNKKSIFKVKLQWEKTNLTNLDKLNNNEDARFYVFSRGNILLYIGMTYKQDISAEVKQSLGRFGINTTGVTIWLGHVAEYSHKRTSLEIIRDVECLLIKAHKPPYNTQCNVSYTGRDSLKVTNRMCPLLKQCIKADGENINYSCR